MNKNQIPSELWESQRTQWANEEFAIQSIPQKMFSAVWSIESEVNNGGFAQYFPNSSSETAAFVAEALDTIGAPKASNICRRAIAAAFPRGLPGDSETISTMATEFPEEVLETLESLDQGFFEYPHDLTELLFKYASQHP